MKKIPFKLSQLSWGWITPGTTEQLREKQEDAFLAFWKKWGTHPHCRFAFTHSGWYLDLHPDAAIRDLTRKNPEPFRASRPASEKLIALWRAALKEKRLEFVVYPYAGCVAEATDGEVLLRALRLTKELAGSTLGTDPEGMLNHDVSYGLDWAMEQAPQMARLLGLRYLLAGKTGVVEALDGSTMPCVGSDRTLIGTVRNLSNEGIPWRPQFVILEMHDHLSFLGKMLAGEYPLQQIQPVQLHSLSRKDFQRHQSRPLPHFSASQMGAKGWFGGLFDVLMIEQAVHRTQKLLQALEILRTFEASKEADCKKQISYWKRSLILTDTAILWQCHDYRRHYRPAAEKLLKDVQAEKEFQSTRQDDHVFNPVSWDRGGVVWDERNDKPIGFHPKLKGWQADPLKAFPNVRKNLFSKSVLLQTSHAQYRLDTKGRCLPVSENAEANPREKIFSGIQRIEESHEKRTVILNRGDIPLSFTGSATLVWDWKVSNQDPPTYLFRVECGKMLGDAYLLECEFFDLSGKVRKRVFHALRALGWEGAGLPRHCSYPKPVELDLQYFQHVRLKIHVVCEGKLQFNGIKVIPLRGARWEPVECHRIEAQLHTSVQYRSLRVRPDTVRQWGGMLKEIRYRLEEDDLQGVLSIRSTSLSPYLDYHLALECGNPAPLGWHTPPMGSAEGSFLGAGCERPYMPGLLFETGVGSQAKYFSDSPYLFREVLRDSPTTWHTDRRDWWMGFSPFVGIQTAAAQGVGYSHLIATRGLHHFFRRRNGDQEMLGLSLGSGIPHPVMQGFSVPESSALFSLIGHSYYHPYRDASIVHAHGKYDFYFAYARMPRRTHLSTLWKTGREYGQPLVKVGAIKNDGIVIRSPHIVATGYEMRGRSRLLRLLNLSSRAVTSSLQMDSKKGKRKTYPISLLPHEIQEMEIPDTTC